MTYRMVVCHGYRPLCGWRPDMSEETTAVLDAPKVAKGKSKPKKTEKKPASTRPPKKGAKAPKAAAPADEGPIDGQVACPDVDACGQVADLFKLISDKTRVLIIRLIALRSANVGQICRHVKCSQPGVSHHLAMLRHSGVIRSDRDGKYNFYLLTPKGRTIAESISLVFGTL